MFEYAGCEFPSHFRLDRPIRAVVVAQAVAAAHLRATGHDVACLAGEAAEAVDLVGDTEAEEPVVIELMRQAELVGAVLDLDRRISRLTKETLTRHAAEAEIDGGNATIKHDLADEELAGVFERGVLGDLPGESRGVELAAAADEVTEAVSILVRVVEAIGEVFRERSGAVKRVTEGVKTAHEALQRVFPLPQRFFGHHIDRAAGIARAEKRCRGAFEEFDGLDVRRVTRGVEAAIRGKPIQHVADAGVVRIAGETANRVVFPQAAEGLLLAHAAHIIKAVLHAHRRDVLELLTGHDADVLRQFAVRNVRPRAAEALRDEKRLLGIGGDDHLVEFLDFGVSGRGGCLLRHDRQSAGQKNKGGDR